MIFINIKAMSPSFWNVIKNYKSLSYIGVQNSTTAVQDTSIFFAFLTSEKLCASWNSCSMLRITIWLLTQPLNFLNYETRSLRLLDSIGRKINCPIVSIFAIAYMWNVNVPICIFYKWKMVFHMWSEGKICFDINWEIILCI